jgi:threonine dehydratase
MHGRPTTCCRDSQTAPLVSDVAGGHPHLSDSASGGGSFKVRGALAALAAAPPGRPVVTASAGNHGLGLAQAAALLGRRATVVVPRTASPAKIERLRGFGVELVLYGDGYDAAEAHALALAEAGALFVSSYNDPHVIARQRTLAVELGEQIDGPMTIVVPVGGGGLLAGVALWAADRADVRVVGVEAAGSRALSASVAAGPSSTSRLRRR